jgi:TrpR-related protein YerC/YecD
MRQSAKPLDSFTQQEALERLAAVLADLKNPKDVKAFLSAFLSETELSLLAKRLGVAHMLNQGKSYDEIQELLQVSTATISSVRGIIDMYGMQLALEKVKLEEWAEKVLRKLHIT